MTDSAYETAKTVMTETAGSHFRYCVHSHVLHVQIHDTNAPLTVHCLSGPFLCRHWWSFDHQPSAHELQDGVKTELQAQSPQRRRLR